MFSTKRIPALDGLRGWAILLVLLFHFTQITVNSPTLKWALRLGRISWSGVDLFFVLSGFLIGGILLDERESPNYFKTFYLRRAYRILPLYFLLLVLSWIVLHVGAAFLPTSLVGLFRNPSPWWTMGSFTQNIWMAATGKFGGGPLAVTWSLAVEEQFYLTLPLLVRKLSRRHLVYATVIMITGAALLRAIIMYASPVNGHLACYVLMPCRADSLGFGVLSAILLRDPGVRGYLVTHRGHLYAGAGVLLVCVLTIAATLDSGTATTLYGLIYSILALFYTSFLLIAVTGEDRFVVTAFCNRPLQMLGSIAYGTYLLNLFSLNLFHQAVSWLHVRVTALNTTLTVFAALLATVLVAALSWKFFEKPLVRLGHRFTY
jgi:peptidoglycan/LPS O-acetylase OafA/YrhL